LKGNKITKPIELPEEEMLPLCKPICNPVLQWFATLAYHCLLTVEMFVLKNGISLRTA